MINKECYAIFGNSYFEGKEREIISDSFDDIYQILDDEGIWTGYLSYELKDDIEALKSGDSYFVNLPKIHLIKFKNRQTYYNSHKNNIINTSPLFSNMTKQEYLDKVLYIKEKIKNGDLYQANLTRKFCGYIGDGTPHDIFENLCNASPSEYSAILKFGDNAIISSSPECFLKINGTEVETRPIKGTMPRYSDEIKDAESKELLRNSIKDRAENLMITDLMRNDLARGCVAGSVKVDKLFDITSYKTIHHLSSIVKGIMKTDISMIDMVKYCFPAGSMTGAPKIQAMKLCNELEGCKRGVYSGAIGIFDTKNMSCDLSVVIRTIIMQGNKFEFQTGGGIIHDSIAQNEWLETIYKAQGILDALGINKQDILKHF